ncbi:sulfate adenylyltransferase subunit CysN [Arcobacter sp. CECT 8985]|uniref:sulfate adenylyltransferase subunit CysN n=1 Tax=Arcobacter sp. CECT 8985 TaxID=1935424 RepID=UPI00100B508E|nr:sulfate adenylyltransferase subunit CysN [Arcobacter sp. CECT 8985]RXJ84584.1 sulfate adenylyltransferase subunit CysN [Arcobacter sp. CECT 8985]
MSHQSNLIESNIEQYLKEHENKELLKFITCGSVDDGKSTLIGRLLHDSKMIFEDQLAAIKKDSKKTNTTDKEFDLALLVDGLQSEREQGITIDVAYRYFSTDKRKFIIADTPGHEQYTRNMATGASTADLAIILIDARYGVQTQTRRHSFITKLLGIKHIVVAVNKMDLVDFSEDRFNEIKKDYVEFAKEIGLENIILVPISALNGDNVVNKSKLSPWYQGDTLMNTLENIEISKDRDLSHFRMPVQYVNRPNLDFRGFCGTIASGVIKVGDEITVLPSGKTSKVKEIVTYEGNLEYAYIEQAITLTLEDEIDISRGDIIVKSDEQPNHASSLDVDIVWMSEEPLTKGKSYYIKRATTFTSGNIEQFYYKTDVNTLQKDETANVLNLNEIASVKLTLEQEIAFDSYEKNKAMGSFIIVDRITNNTVGAGMIRNKSKEQSKIDSNYSDFEIELNALVRKHFPHWDAKVIK